MKAKSWTREEILAFAALYGVRPETDEELDRMKTLASRVTDVAASIRRMPCKGDEPASIFKVPL